MAKDDTQAVDEATLVPMLKQMDRVRDVTQLQSMADTFLESCRFAADKVATLRREIKNKSDAKSIQLFCWNVLLSGQGQAVIKW